jgi:hypothetical protein
MLGKSGLGLFFNLPRTGIKDLFLFFGIFISAEIITEMEKRKENGITKN